MCVQSRGLKWERPATAEDCEILRRHFKGIDFPAVFKAMSVYGFVPLASDLALVGAVVSAKPDGMGFRYLPFSGFDFKKQIIVKIPAMDGIVEWFENTALGGEMWASASRWMNRAYGCNISFTMNCGCFMFPKEAREDGRLEAWLRRFNGVRSGIVGRTKIKVRQSVRGTDITEAQVVLWQRVRTALQALPAEKPRARGVTCKRKGYGDETGPIRGSAVILTHCVN